MNIEEIKKKLEEIPLGNWILIALYDKHIVIDDGCGVRKTPRLQENPQYALGKLTGVEITKNTINIIFLFSEYAGLIPLEPTRKPKCCKRKGELIIYYLLNESGVAYTCPINSDERAPEINIFTATPENIADLDLAVTSGKIPYEMYWDLMEQGGMKWDQTPLLKEIRIAKQLNIKLPLVRELLARINAALEMGELIKESTLLPKSTSIIAKGILKMIQFALQRLVDRKWELTKILVDYWRKNKTPEVIPKKTTKTSTPDDTQTKLL